MQDVPVSSELQLHDRVDPLTIRAIDAFLDKLPLQHALRAVVLFGSRARQDHRADSDADLALVFSGGRGDRYRTVSDMAAISFDVMLATGILIQAHPLWAEEFDCPETAPNPSLIETIRREGIRHQR